MLFCLQLAQIFCADEENYSQSEYTANPVQKSQQEMRKNLGLDFTKKRSKMPVEKSPPNNRGGLYFVFDPSEPSELHKK